MAVFRVERNKGYTVMSNHHLRNKELTLKAKGLLSQMLSLPEDWDYTLAGLSQINREKIDAIREAIKELERAGYIVRSRERDEKGRLRGADYVIYEQPHTEPTPDLPTLENPTLDNPTQEKPTLEKPTLENPMQLNKDIQRTDLPTKEKINTDLQSTHSIPILSPNPSPLEQEAATPPERKRKEADTQSAYEIYREIIKGNIDYDILMQDMKFDGDRLNEIVDLMLETVCPRRKTIRIAKQLNISPQQMSYVTHSEAGEGLLFYGNVILPFVDRFPKDTELYRVMTTKPEECLRCWIVQRGDKTNTNKKGISSILKRL